MSATQVVLRGLYWCCWGHCGVGIELADHTSQQASPWYTLSQYLLLVNLTQWSPVSSLLGAWRSAREIYPVAIWSFDLSGTWTCGPEASGGMGWNEAVTNNSHFFTAVSNPTCLQAVSRRALNMNPHVVLQRAILCRLSIPAVSVHGQTWKSRECRPSSNSRQLARQTAEQPEELLSSVFTCHPAWNLANAKYQFCHWVSLVSFSHELQ